MKNIKRFLKGSIITLLIAMGLTLNLSPAPFAENSVPLIESAYAQEEAAETDAGSGEDEEGQQEPREPAVKEDFLEDVAQLVTQAHYLLSPTIFFFTNHIGTLLSNDYIFAGQMGTMLNTIWVVSRNIVNIVFVLILLFLAVRHIFGSQGEGGVELKKALPKFVIMLIAINFSWLASKVVLDAANVATNVVFAIPSGVKGVIGDTSEPCVITDGKKNEYCMPAGQIKNIDSAEQAHFAAPGANVTIINNGEEVNADDCPTFEEIQSDEKGLSKKRIFCWRQLDYARFSKSNAAYYLTYGLASVQNLVRANTGEVNVQGLTKAGIGFLFSFILILVYMLAMLVMFIVLIARYAMLWLFVGFSPFLVLLWYMKDFNVQGDEKFSIGAFIQWAFVPAKIGAVFSVGFIMITTGQRMNNFFLSTAETADGDRYVVTNMKAIFQGMDNIQEFLWLTMTVVIIWFGVFWAVSKLEAIQPIINGIKNYATSTAKLAGRAAYAAPIVPLGEGQPKSIQDIVGQVSPREQLKKYADKGAQQIIDRDAKISGIKNNADQMARLKEQATAPKQFVKDLNRFGVSTAMLAQAEEEGQLNQVLSSFGEGWENNTALMNEIKAQIQSHKGEKVTVEKERRRAEEAAASRSAEKTPDAKTATPDVSKKDVDPDKEKKDADKKKKEGEGGEGSTPAAGT